jgi:cytochrome b561
MPTHYLEDPSDSRFHAMPTASCVLTAQRLAAPGRVSTDRYGGVAVALHWLVGVAVLGQIALGWSMQGVAKDPPGVRAGWYNVHKSVGLTLALLVGARLAWRRRHAPPALPPRIPRWQQRAAGASHAALYACLVLMPLTGYLGSSFTSHPVLYFGHALPHWGWDWPAAKALMSALHRAAAWTLASLVALHVAAALAHLARGDGVFARMWPPSGRA